MTSCSLKTEVEEGPSKHLQQGAEGKTHTFQCSLNSQTLSVPCNISMTVKTALNKIPYFKDEKGKKKNMDKEILIQRSRGAVPRAAVKTDFPCCLIERDEIVSITFIKKEVTSSTDQETTVDPSLRFVTFWIKKEGGQKVQCILKSKALRSSIQYVCVYAFKGETIKIALKRDGRFRSNVFRKHCALSDLSSDLKHELSFPVDDLNGKAFQVVVLSDRNQPESQDDLTPVKTEPNVASDAVAAETVGSSKNPINIEQRKKQGGNTRWKSTNPSTKQYVTKPIVNSEEILGILRDQFPVLVKQIKHREKLKKSEIQEFFRAEYDKSVQSFSEVYKIKQLMRLSDSVCQIRVEGSARGTGFLLFGRFVLTNAHVVMKFLESPDKLSSTIYLEAAFDFERLDSKVKLVPVKKNLAAYCYLTDANKSRLDFALLELDDVDEITGRPGLLRRYTRGSPPNHGGICIVGHPDDGIKKADPCFIIENPQEAADKHIFENVKFFHVMTQKNIEDKWDVYENQINYNSCFFHGSSGSPVFDEDCHLIGVHTGGYVYPGEEGKTRSIVEYAYSIQPILDMIRAQAKIKGLDEVVNTLEAYCNKSNESGTAE